MDFKETLLEAYRKKENNGRYEFSTGKNTKIIVSPQYGDLTTYQFDPKAKRKKTKEDKKALTESVVNVFKKMISSLAANAVSQAVEKNPNMSPEQYSDLKNQTTQSLKSMSTDQLVTQYANAQGQPTVVQQKQQQDQEEQDANDSGQPYDDPDHSTNYVSNRV